MRIEPERFAIPLVRGSGKGDVIKKKVSAQNIKKIESTDIPEFDWRPGLPQKQTEMCWALCHPKQVRCSPEGRQQIDRTFNVV